MSPITFKLTAATNVGMVRKNNEDNFIVCPDLSASLWSVPEDADSVSNLSEEGCILCVADGMGGMNAGEVASDIAVNSIKDSFSSRKSKLSLDKSNFPAIESFMKKAIVTADKKIKEKAKSDSSTNGMGTTIVLAWIKSSYVNVAWCGDSRAYLFNPVSGLVRLSKDHSYVQQLIDNGSLDPEMAFYHPDSNIITRSLGDSCNKAQPDYMHRVISAGDIILLCTDGLCGLIQDDEIQKILMAEKDCLERCKSVLIDAALAAGGHDNVTVALYQCVGDELEEDFQKTNPNIVPRRRGLFWWKK